MSESKLPLCSFIFSLACSRRIFSIARSGFLASASSIASRRVRDSSPFSRLLCQSIGVPAGACARTSELLTKQSKTPIQNARLVMLPPYDCDIGPSRSLGFARKGQSRIELFINFQQITSHSQVEAFRGPLRQLKRQKEPP